MSWLLENWFGSKESLDQVREDIREHAHKETYLGVSGIENPELSSNRVEPSELFLSLHGPWEDKLQDIEEELLQFIHDELPPIVRDEVGIIPFFTSVLPHGYLMLTFIRNASEEDILLNQLPLSLVTPDGEVVAQKTFDMLSFGSIGDYSSRPCEFVFRWEEFTKVPEQVVPLSLVFDAPPVRKAGGKDTPQDGLTSEEMTHYEKIAKEQPAVPSGEVELKVLGIKPTEEGGLKVVVLFRNGLDKTLEFTEVPIIIRDKSGEEVARAHFGLKNLHVAAKDSRVWGFCVPADSLTKTDVNPEECTAFIPDAKPDHPRNFGGGSAGLVQ
ncbi:SLAP domain-containing protein [Brevibacillus massiliensis]|jgi:SLAP domain-containing protein|uniref:SLAP domain-containing protein n=1 Tax=Brevibacillus massiliensis TaxID=1118054 RepID=UPI0002F234B0|nr:SLAP domain-containing protein [Brevibacillus massiliensis]